MSSDETLAGGDGKCAAKAESDASIDIIAEGGVFAGEEAGGGGAVGVGVAESAGGVEAGGIAGAGPGDEAAGRVVAMKGGE